MSTYRYLATSLLTGQVLGDWLPVIPTSLSRTINTVGAFTGALDLTAGSDLEVINNRFALEPERRILWIFQDQVPVWCGIVWDQPHESILDNTLPLSCATPESLFQHRLITDDLAFTGDLFDIFRGLASYALGKAPNGQMAGWTMSTNQSGVVLDDVTFAASDMQSVYDAWTTLITAYGFEYSVRPALDASGNVYMNLDLGYPTLGLPLATSGLGFNMPGNLLDYAFPRTGSTAANTVYATASATATPINATWIFTDSGIGDWTGSGGASVGLASGWSASGTGFSLSITGNGFSTAPQAEESVTVTPGTSYTLSAELFSAAGWPDCELLINWYDEFSTLISTSSSDEVAVAAAIATPASVSAEAPSVAGGDAADAVLALLVVQMNTTPPGGVTLLADTIVFSVATSGNWQSQLPHGQDIGGALAEDYPLLEVSESLTTLTATSQALVDSFADGQMQQMTGTQLVPLLIIGNDQYPQARNVTLGSWCSFNATSALHPSPGGNVPGLQTVGRVVGWTLTPPTDTQQETTQYQLGEIDDADGTLTPYAGASAGGGS